MFVIDKFCDGVGEEGKNDKRWEIIEFGESKCGIIVIGEKGIEGVRRGGSVAFIDVVFVDVMWNC